MTYLIILAILAIVALIFMLVFMLRSSTKTDLEKAKEYQTELGEKFYALEKILNSLPVHSYPNLDDLECQIGLNEEQKYKSIYNEAKKIFDEKLQPLDKNRDNPDYDKIFDIIVNARGSLDSYSVDKSDCMLQCTSKSDGTTQWSDNDCICKDKNYKRSAKDGFIYCIQAQTPMDRFNGLKKKIQETEPLLQDALNEFETKLKDYRKDECKYPGASESLVEQYDSADTKLADYSALKRNITSILQRDPTLTEAEKTEIAAFLNLENAKPYEKKFTDLSCQFNNKAKVSGADCVC